MLIGGDKMLGIVKAFIAVVIVVVIIFTAMMVYEFYDDHWGK